MIEGVPPGRAVMAVFGAGLQFEKPVDVPLEQDVTLDIVFPTGARLSGRVTQGGRPAANKTVWIGPVEISPAGSIGLVPRKMASTRSRGCHR